MGALIRSDKAAMVRAAGPCSAMSVIAACMSSPEVKCALRPISVDIRICILVCQDFFISMCEGGTIASLCPEPGRGGDPGWVGPMEGGSYTGVLTNQLFNAQDNLMT